MEQIVRYALKIADKSVLTPLIYDGNYINFLLKYCLNKIIFKLYVIIVDIDLPILAKNKQKFADNGITVVVGDFDFIQTCNDKWLTYNFFIKNKFLIPLPHF
ncbi:MAG: hypothetical protein U5Q03_00850 [Bacteroidota bacterium]|nr:hypothetical protein [Bacteroidota bacterium]